MSQHKHAPQQNGELHHLSDLSETAANTLGDIISSVGYSPGVGITMIFLFGIFRYMPLIAATITVIGLTIVILFIRIIHKANGSGGVSTLLARNPHLRFLTIPAANSIRIDYLVTGPVSLASFAWGIMSIFGLYGQKWPIAAAITIVMLAAVVLLVNRGIGESGKIMKIIVGSFVMTLGVVTVLAVIADITGVKALTGTPHLDENVPAHLAVYSAVALVIATFSTNFTGVEALSNYASRIKQYTVKIVETLMAKHPSWTFLHWFEGSNGVASILQLVIGFLPIASICAAMYFVPRFNAYNGVQGRESLINLAFVAGTVFGPIFGIVFGYWMASNNCTIQTAATVASATDWCNTGCRDALAGLLPMKLAHANKHGGFPYLNAAYFVIGATIVLVTRASMTLLLVLYGQMVWYLIANGAFGLTAEGKMSKSRFLLWFGMIATPITASVFAAQVVFKWQEGGWAALSAFLLVTVGSLVYFVSPYGYRDQEQVRLHLEQSPFPPHAQQEMLHYVERIQDLRADLLQTIDNTSRTLQALPQTFWRYAVSWWPWRSQPSYTMNLDALAADPDKEKEK